MSAARSGSTKWGLSLSLMLRQFHNDYSTVVNHSLQRSAPEAFLFLKKRTYQVVF